MYGVEGRCPSPWQTISAASAVAMGDETTLLDEVADDALRGTAGDSRVNQIGSSYALASCGEG